MANVEVPFSALAGLWALNWNKFGTVEKTAMLIY
jgi:hypothetical protein